MQLSNAGLELIKKSEGFRGKAYRDIAGIPTIGYGHRLLPGESLEQEMDERRAEQILIIDVADAERAVSRLVRVPLIQGQFDALVDFCFNLGAGRLAGSTLLRELNAGRHDSAALQILCWDHAGGKEIAALKTRREAEFRLWMGRENPPILPPPPYTNQNPAVKL